MRMSSRAIPPAVAYVACAFVEKAFSFITIPLMAIYVPPSEYGRYDLAISLVEFFGIVFAFGLGDTLIRFTSPIAFSVAAFRFPMISDSNASLSAAGSPAGLLRQQS